MSALVEAIDVPRKDPAEDVQGSALAREFYRQRVYEREFTNKVLWVVVALMIIPFLVNPPSSEDFEIEYTITCEEPFKARKYSGSFGTIVYSSFIDGEHVYSEVEKVTLSSDDRKGPYLNGLNDVVWTANRSSELCNVSIEVLSGGVAQPESNYAEVHNHEVDVCILLIDGESGRLHQDDLHPYSWEKCYSEEYGTWYQKNSDDLWATCCIITPFIAIFGLLLLPNRPDGE